MPALAGASFALRKGELLALLGPNGADKTTLIRAIAGRVRLDAARSRVGPLLDEAESETLERLVSTNTGMVGVLIGKWLLVLLIGVARRP